MTGLNPVVVQGMNQKMDGVAFTIQPVFWFLPWTHTCRYSIRAEER